MDRSQLPLNALRAFDAAARHLSFTRAAAELCVTQAALSHHIRLLEERLGFALFQRLPRGVILTDEGAALAPALNDSFERITRSFEAFAAGRIREIVTVGVVSSFATGWLLPRLHDFSVEHPTVEIRVRTNNNTPELAGEGLDCAIRYGDGFWHGTEAVPIMPAPLLPMCAPAKTASLRGSRGFAGEVLLRSYRSDEWPAWFAARGMEIPKLTGPVFDSSLAIAHAVMSGVGIGLLPPSMFGFELESERMAVAHNQSIMLGHYWLTRLQTRESSPGLIAFEEWLLRKAEKAQRTGV